ncbi:hypothetical protein [Limnobacter sp.]|uniref:hypothetical protein n=1 Tax=Limnobacter sp. TaxID=2003368 RepID=UPI0035140933
MFKPGLNVKQMAACSVTLLVLQSGVAQAHGDAKGHSHQHDAHVHGVGELEMVQEGQVGAKLSAKKPSIQAL